MLGSGLLLMGLIACGGDEPPEVQPDKVDLRQAVSALRAGEMAAALSTFDAGVAADPTSYDAAVGASFGALISGDLDRADALLAGVKVSAGQKSAEILLRRAVVASRKGDMAATRTFAESSGLEAGMVLAAEAALADGDPDGAIQLLTPIAEGSGVHADLAGAYMALLKDEDPIVAVLAEGYALWGLGQRSAAVSAVEGLILALPEDRTGRDAELMLWAARAASEGEPEVAIQLLESVRTAPAGQGWRIEATRAIALCAKGETATCIEKLKALEDNAPADGLLYARITAALQLGPEQKTEAVALIGERVSHASARAALRFGELEMAKRLSPDGMFKRYLESR